jgi:hypothetical protein
MAMAARSGKCRDPQIQRRLREHGMKIRSDVARHGNGIANAQLKYEGWPTTSHYRAGPAAALV